MQNIKVVVREANALFLYLADFKLIIKHKKHMRTVDTFTF